ncbi:MULTISPECIES: SusC/RagA family TonB-linked outer membrane protein [Sphingobacterium]|uniref:SusC/RagA family TonB-linked outer membrane protein n=1 Tax=Sphingobacterium TaxID=28453 RepID=UPI0013DA35ED|nr:MULTISPECIES: SusC/RagA family TonB-linked outer membrane protein [unclassified Sphingobacterium]
MNKFLRGGRGLSFCEGEHVNMLSRYKIGTGPSYQDLSNRPIEQDKYVISTNRSSRRYTPFRSKSGTRHDDGGIVRHTAYSLGLIAFKIVFCVLFSQLAFTQAVAQTQSGSVLQGEVRSAADGQAIEGASVTVDKKHVRTDKEGRFTISVDPPTGVLTIKHIGYKEQSVAYENTSTFIKIQLQPNENTIDEVEVVSTGYQIIPKERATGSFYRVDNKQLDNRASTNIINKLNGIASGLVFNKQRITGQDELQIRGRSTLFANEQPLVVLDNFPYEGSLNQINPNDIADIVLLKDAAAASIWGVRAGNGVIVITTKKGSKSDRPRIDFNANNSISAKPDLMYNPNFIPAKDFIEFERILFDKNYYQADLISKKRAPLSPVVQLLYAHREEEITDDELSRRLALYEGYDIRREMGTHIYRHARDQQYAVQFSGGTANYRYLFSTGYDRKDLSTVRDYNDRITLRSSNQFDISKALQVGVDFNFAKIRATFNKGGINLNTGNGRGIYPYLRLSDENGNPLQMVKDYQQPFADEATENGFLNWIYAPLYDIGLHTELTHGRDIRIEPSINYRLFDGLEIQGKYFYQDFRSDRYELAEEDSYYTRDLINRYATVSTAGLVTKLDNIPLGSILDETYSGFVSHNLRGQFRLSRTIASDHQVDAILGAEQKMLSRNSSSLRTYGYNEDNGSSKLLESPLKSYTLYPSGMGAPIPSLRSLGSGEDRFRSYFSNVSYSYGNYTISASCRIDQSNFFGVNANQKSVPLWSSGFKWRASNECFYNIQWLPELSLRATYGYNGNLDRSLTGVTILRFNPTPAPISGLPYADINTLGNPDLRWERIAMLNLGLDFATKTGLLRGSVEYFKKNGKDMIGDAPMPPSSGVQNFRGNYAEISGQGLDIVVKLNKSFVNEFRWHSAFQWSWATDKVKKYETSFAPALYFGASGNTFDKYPIEGYPLYAVFSMPWAGLDPVNGNPRGYIEEVASDDYVALNTPALEDIHYHGPAKPVYFGNLFNELSYKGFYASFNIVYKLGYYFRRGSINYNSLINNWSGHRDFAIRWEQPGDELRTDVPSMLYPNNTNRDIFYQRASVLVEKGDHVRLQYINMGYEFRRRSESRIPFHSFRLYTQLDNLVILWKANKQGLDPDFQAYASAAAVSIPTPFLFTLGLKLNY